MDKEVVAQFADVMVRCPVPGLEHHPAERLGDFLQTELGRSVLAQSVDNISVLINTGMDAEKAATIALGAAIVRDDEGNMVRAQLEPELAFTTPAEPEAESSKKK